jgi:hypothetical protein
MCCLLLAPFVPGLGLGLWFGLGLGLDLGLPSPCHNHVTTMSQPCHIHVTSMSRPCHDHVTTMPPPRHHRVTITTDPIACVPLASVVTPSASVVITCAANSSTPHPFLQTFLFVTFSPVANRGNHPQAALQAKGVLVYLVTGGFRRLIMPIAALLNIPEENCFANVLEFDVSARSVRCFRAVPLCPNLLLRSSVASL